MRRILFCNTVGFAVGAVLGAALALSFGLSRFVGLTLTYLFAGIGWAVAADVADTIARLHARRELRRDARIALAVLDRHDAPSEDERRATRVAGRWTW